MKNISWLIPSTLVIILGTVNTASSKPIQIAPNFQPDPLLIQGISGGTEKSDCGFIAKTPNQIIEVTKDISSLRFSVESKGNPTLLINGPKGRFCVPGDSLSGGKIQLPGYGDKGSYSIFIGDRDGGQYPFTLSISQKSN